MVFELLDCEFFGVLVACLTVNRQVRDGPELLIAASAKR